MTTTTQINKRRLFKRAWHLFKGNDWNFRGLTFSECLKQVWKEIKDFAAEVKAEAEAKAKRLQEDWSSNRTPLDCSEYYNRPSGSYYGD